MNNKKELEREKLHKTIWKIANELRGSVDGWDFKQYVLGLLFYRFISENIEHYVNENQRKAGIKNFEYRNISDEEALMGKSQILDEKGLFILPSELFCNVRLNAAKNENLNVVISNIFDNIEASARGTASENDVKGLFDDFTIDNKLGNTVDERNEKLVKLLNAIGDLRLGDYCDNNIDLFGDASEEFVRNTNKNKLSDENINNIVNLLKDRISVENKAYLATYDEIKENAYNISVNSYLKNNAGKVEIDIKEVNKKLAEIVPRQQQIRNELEEIIRELESDYYE